MSIASARLRSRGLGPAAVVASLLLLSAIAWLSTHGISDRDMRLGILTSPPERSMERMEEPMSGMEGSGRGSMSMAFGLFMATWVVMMVAMMFPAVAPVVLTFRRWGHSRGRPGSATVAFVAGYLAVWAAIGVVAYALLEALHHWVPAESTTALRVGAVLLIAAGVYQLTPLKNVCLRHCRSPLSVLMQHSQTLSQGHSGPLKVGVVHGLYCVGCCWSLMVVLVLLGMMNLVWMGVVAAVVFVEKVLPRGETVSRAVGLGLVGLGVVLSIWPTALPALT